MLTGFTIIKQPIRTLCRCIAVPSNTINTAGWFLFSSIHVYPRLEVDFGYKMAKNRDFANVNGVYDYKTANTHVMSMQGGF